MHMLSGSLEFVTSFADSSLCVDTQPSVFHKVKSAGTTDKAVEIWHRKTLKWHSVGPHEDQYLFTVAVANYYGEI